MVISCRCPTDWSFLVLLPSVGFPGASELASPACVWTWWAKIWLPLARIWFVSTTWAPRRSCSSTLSSMLTSCVTTCQFDNTHSKGSQILQIPVSTWVPYCLALFILIWFANIHLNFRCRPCVFDWIPDQHFRCSQIGFFHFFYPPPACTWFSADPEIGKRIFPERRMFTHIKMPESSGP